MSDIVFALSEKVQIFKKVKFFVWQILYGRVNTLDKVLRKVLDLIGTWCCILCRRVVEDLDCIFWSCAFTYVVWSRVFEEFNLGAG